MSEKQEIVIPSELLEKDSIELSNDEVAIQKIIEYLKATRINVRDAESSGKRISKKSATTKVPKKYDKNPLDLLLSEV
jgi:hypothetical protein